ncbi:hypothetical protein [Echinicola vietnamensis]|nr:hypothetical protein [Echinicola vietnamensis]
MHRGKVLKSIINSHPDSGKVIAKRAGYEPGTLYKHYQIENLSYQIITKYAKAMWRDLSIEFPEINKEISFQSFKQEYDNRDKQQNANTAYEWKDKYHRLLESHNEILKMNMNLKEEIRNLENELKNLKRKKI